MKMASWCVVKPSIMVLRFWRKLLSGSGIMLECLHSASAPIGQNILPSCCCCCCFWNRSSGTLRAHMNKWNHRNLLESILIMVQIWKSFRCRIEFSVCSVHAVLRIEIHQFLHFPLEMQYLKIQNWKYQIWIYQAMAYLIRLIQNSRSMKVTFRYFLRHRKTNNNPICNHNFCVKTPNNQKHDINWNLNCWHETDAYFQRNEYMPSSFHTIFRERETHSFRFTGIFQYYVEFDVIKQRTQKIEYFSARKYVEARNLITFQCTKCFAALR